MDYSFLRSEGECGAVLIYLAQDPQRQVSIYPLTRALGRHTFSIARALDTLLELGLIDDKWEVVEVGKPARRFYGVTEQGQQAVEQLNT